MEIGERGLGTTGTEGRTSRQPVATSGTKLEYQRAVNILMAFDFFRKVWDGGLRPRLFGGDSEEIGKTAERSLFQKSTRLGEFSLPGKRSFAGEEGIPSHKVNIFLFFSVYCLNKQSVGSKTANFFVERCLTVGSKRRIKPFAPTSWPCPKGRREKGFSRMAKKSLTRV